MKVRCNMKKKYVSIVFYSVAVLLGLIYLICELMPGFNLSELGRLFLLCGSCCFLYFGGWLLSKSRKDNKAMKINLWIFFLLYIILLVTLTLFDTMWGRNGFTFINWFSDEFIAFLEHSINLVPFKTIMTFVKQFNSMYDNRTILLNLFGNLLALMPMAFFLPLLFKKQNKFKYFIITVLLIILGIEVTQLLTTSGKFDIDDFILNASGATILYFILKIKDVNKLIKNIFLLEKNKISKKSLFTILTSVILVILCAIALVSFRTKLYKNNYDEYNRTHNPQFTIIDERGENCEKTIDLFYENNLYQYYFPCMKSDKVFINVKGDKKYLVKDFLKNKTYHYDIERMLQALDSYKIAYIKKNKYEYIPLAVKVPIDANGSYSSPQVLIKNNNENSLDTKYDFEDDFESAIFHYKLHLIPKKKGTSTIHISFKNNDKLLKSYKYSITITNELNVSFKEIKEGANE